MEPSHGKGLTPQTPLQELVTTIKAMNEEEILQGIRTGLFDSFVPGLSLTANVSQGNVIHLEGSVDIHTAKVVTRLKACAASRNLPIDDIDLLCALMHDVEKPSTIAPHPAFEVYFPGHEEKAAHRVPAIARVLKLSPEQERKLLYLVAEHGIVHGWPELSHADQSRLCASPHWKNLALLQQADAESCFRTIDGRKLSPIYWDDIVQFQSQHQK